MVENGGREGREDRTVKEGQGRHSREGGARSQGGSRYVITGQDRAGS